MLFFNFFFFGTLPHGNCIKLKKIEQSSDKFMITQNTVERKNMNNLPPARLLTNDGERESFTFAFTDVFVSFSTEA